VYDFAPILPSHPSRRTVSSGISGASYYEGSFANVVRSTSGEYLGVSSRGNFYMAWAPGDANWMPFNRPANRRIQNLGWTPDDRIWVSSRGGDLLVNAKSGITGEGFEKITIGSRGFGLLDFGCVRGGTGEERKARGCEVARVECVRD